MFQKIFFPLLLSCCLHTSLAQTQKAQNLVVITLDGMRWQEVFGGIDTELINNKDFTRDSAGLRKVFWDEDAKERRKKLFPFFWTTVAQRGQLYGNRKYGNFANVKNPYKFSYPGYNEIFTGYPDTAVNSTRGLLCRLVSPKINIENSDKFRHLTSKIYTDGTEGKEIQICRRCH